MESDRELMHDPSMQKDPPSYTQTEAPYSMQVSCTVDYPLDLGMPAQMMTAPVHQPVVVDPQIYAQQQSSQIHIIQQSGGYLWVGPKPVTTKCLNCHTTIQTKTSSNYKCGAHLCCVFLTLVGCWLCCCIPYCMDSYKNVEHSCPKCNVRIGEWRG